jgi:hypothetical protein
MVILAGVAVGYEDVDHKINHINTGRDAYNEQVEFIQD